MELEFIQTNKGDEREWQRNKSSRVVRFKDYDVFATLGGQRIKLGRVYQRLATMEQRTPGKRYVNRRWESPRWFYAVEGGDNRYSHRLTHETRQEAARRLREHFPDAA